MPEQTYFNLLVAGINIRFVRVDDGITLVCKEGEAYFFENRTNILLSDKINYDCDIRIGEKKEFPIWPVIFKGEPWGNYELPYYWQIASHEQQIAITVDFSQGHELVCACIFIHPIKQSIEIILDTKEPIYQFSPFMYPLGVLMQIYLIHYSNGFMLHGSGVLFKGNGYLFSGLSGIGKSTMAKLWQQAGAIIINDDRLALMPGRTNYKAYNTPMPYYTDIPKETEVKALFLLEQSPHHFVKKISEVESVLRIMANCMQHFHSREFISTHLDIINKFVKQTPVYHLGFAPTVDVVDFILDELNHELK